MLICPERFLHLCFKFINHGKGCIMFGIISGYCRINANRETISVFHQDVTHITQFRRLSLGFPVKFGFGIGLRFVCVILPFFPMKINSWITWISVILAILLLGVFFLKTL